MNNESKSNAPHFGENMDYDFHRLLNEHHASVTPKSGTFTVDRMPYWVQNGDIITERDGKLYVQSFTQRETRWQKFTRWLKRWIATH